MASIYTQNCSTQLLYPELDADITRIVGYSDTTFANIDDLSWQIKRIPFFVDDYDNVAPVLFKS